MKKNTKVTSGILLALVIVIVSILSYRHFIYHAKNAKLQKETAQQQAQDNQKKSQTIDASKAPDQNTYSPPTDPGNIELSANQTNASQVVVTTKLTGYSDGTCSLTVNNADKTAMQSAPVIFQSQFSTCAGFTVPVSSLGTGTWTLSLSVTSSGVTNQKSTTVTVQ